MKLAYTKRSLCAVGIIGLFVIGLVWENKAVAQTPTFSITQTGTASTNSFPWSSVNIPIQLLIAPGQINGAYKGKITKLYFRRGGSNASGSTFSNLNIRMQQPATYDMNAANTAYIAGTTVYSGVATVPAGTTDQWFAITLPTPYLYDPALPLLVRICNSSITGGFSARTYNNTSGRYHRIYNTNPLSSGCSSMTGYGIDRYLYPFGIDEMPACEVPAGMLSVAVTDASGTPLSFASIPGQVYAKIYLAYPTGATNVTATLDFFRVGGSTTVPAFTATINTSKADGITLDALYPVSIPNTVSPGYYRVVATVNSLNTCAEYGNTVLPEKVLMLVNEGTEPCIVWPGDANNDGIVNYGDRKSLNMYIREANLSPTWLNGPGRYRADAATNPFTYFTWEGQPAVPWQTLNGCYMDCDGNGSINNFDYLAMKFNWVRTHGTPKDGSTFSAMTFDMDQNYPNPFNPATTIRFAAPERAQVTLKVYDMLGRDVATLVNGELAAGIHSAVFDGGNLQSGAYIATIVMIGAESGLSFNKTIRMNLNK